MKRDELIHALAVYLTTNVDRKSTECLQGLRDGIAWATAFKAAGIRGRTVADAEQALRSVLDAEATYPAHHETPDIEGAELSAKAAGGTL